MGKPPPTPPPPPPSADSHNPPYTVFISHAGGDKHTIAVPLREKLLTRNITAFVDVFDLSIGSSVPDLLQAINTAKVAVIVLSPEFVARKRPMWELMHFLRRRDECEARGLDCPIIIPFFYRLSVTDLYDEPRLDRTDRDGSPLYTKQFFQRMQNGEPEANVTEIKRVLMILQGIMGVRNTVDANNDSSYDMSKKRELLVHTLCDTICQIATDSDAPHDEDAIGNAMSAFRARSQGEVDPRILEKALRDGEPDRLNTVRLMVLGAPSRGKTSTIASLRRKPFDDDRNSTIGIDLSIHYIAVGAHSLSEAQTEHLKKLSRFQARYRAYQEKQILEAAAKRAFSDENNESIEHSLNNSTTDADPDTQSTEPIPSEVYNIANEKSEISEVSIPNCITLRCWDFGGQPEYEVAHELFISPRSIVMLVFDLPRFEDIVSREEEVLQLQHWIQTIYAATSKKELRHTFKSIMIVGTKRDNCRKPDADEMFRKLRGMLSDKLDSEVTSQWTMWEVPMIAVENEIAVENMQGSGLSDLEKHLERTAKEIVHLGEAVPLRWLAFLERLRVRYDDSESWKSFSMNQHDVEKLSAGLQFSSEKVEDVIVEVHSCLKHLRNLGEVVLFDVASLSLAGENGSYILFPRPERILQALKVIVAPEEVRCDRLSDCRDRKMMQMGILTCTAMEEKWGELAGLLTQEERQKLLSLMTSMDIFIILKSTESSGVYGVPSLLKTSWDDLHWLKNNTDTEHEVHLLTRFVGCIPFGFAGTFIGRLHRTIGNERTDIRLMRGNAVLLSFQNERGHFQIFVGFRNEKRELHWKVRGPRRDMGLVGKCLSELEAHKRERLIGTTHYIMTGCPQKCSEKKFGLLFEIPVARDEGKPWWKERNATLADVSRSCGTALCENIDCSWSSTLCEAVGSTEVSEKPSILTSPRRAEFEVFISHAGPDKKTMALPLYERLTGLGISTFLDERELRPGDKAVPGMERAMDEALILVAITSPEFCVRHWPMRELKRFLTRRRHEEEEAKKELEGSSLLSRFSQFFGYRKGGEAWQVDADECMRPVILPLFYRLDVAECRYLDLTKLHDDDQHNMKHFRELVNRTTREANTKLYEMRESMRRLADYNGIENKGSTNQRRACNEDTAEMEAERKLLVDKVVDAVIPHIRRIRDGNPR